MDNNEIPSIDDLKQSYPNQCTLDTSGMGKGECPTKEDIVNYTSPNYKCQINGTYDNNELVKFGDINYISQMVKFAFNLNIEILISTSRPEGTTQENTYTTLSSFTCIIQDVTTGQSIIITNQYNDRLDLFSGTSGPLYKLTKQFQFNGIQSHQYKLIEAHANLIPENGDIVVQDLSAFGEEGESLSDNVKNTILTSSSIPTLDSFYGYYVYTYYGGQQLYFDSIGLVAVGAFPGGGEYSNPEDPDYKAARIELMTNNQLNGKQYYFLDSRGDGASKNFTISYKATIETVNQCIITVTTPSSLRENYFYFYDIVLPSFVDVNSMNSDIESQRIYTETYPRVEDGKLKLFFTHSGDNNKTITFNVNDNSKTDAKVLIFKFTYKDDYWLTWL